MLDEIDLIVSILGTIDAIGVPQCTERMKRVLCDASGITRAEFAAAGQVGHRPSLRVTVSAADYDGEEWCEYHQKRYYIYRSYPVNNGWDIELYLEDRTGDHGS